MNERDNADCGIEADNLIELEALPDDDPRRVVSDSGLGRINFRPPRCFAWVVRIASCFANLCFLSRDVSLFG
jgi:hypothetical protein